MQFDHKQLDVYQLTRQFVSWCNELLNQRHLLKEVRMAEVSDRLDRASLSILLNDARGSATERTACLDALVVKKSGNSDRVSQGKEMPPRIVLMLCKLVERYDVGHQVREIGWSYQIEQLGGDRVEDD